MGLPQDPTILEGWLTVIFWFVWPLVILTFGLMAAATWVAAVRDQPIGKPLARWIVHAEKPIYGEKPR